VDLETNIVLGVVLHDREDLPLAGLVAAQQEGDAQREDLALQHDRGIKRAILDHRADQSRHAAPVQELLGSLDLQLVLVEGLGCPFVDLGARVLVRIVLRD
jgi:hypothetical protein